MRFTLGTLALIGAMAFGIAGCEDRDYDGDRDYGDDTTIRGETDVDRDAGTTTVPSGASTDRGTEIRGSGSAEGQLGDERIEGEGSFEGDVDMDRSSDEPSGRMEPDGSVSPDENLGTSEDRDNQRVPQDNE